MTTISNAVHEDATLYRINNVEGEFQRWMCSRHPAGPVIEHIRDGEEKKHCLTCLKQKFIGKWFFTGDKVYQSPLCTHPNCLSGASLKPCVACRKEFCSVHLHGMDNLCGKCWEEYGDIESE